ASQIIFADTEGLFDASLATCPVVVGPLLVVVGVVGLELPVLAELPPHAARSDAQATDAMATVRMFTNRIVPTDPFRHRSGTGAPAEAAIAFAGCAGPSYSQSSRASRARSSWS